MWRTTSPLIRTVPLVSFTATPTAFAARLIAAAAQWRAPRPLVSVMSAAEAPKVTGRRFEYADVETAAKKVCHRQKTRLWFRERLQTIRSGI